MSEFKTLKVTIEWPLEKFECLAGAIADLSDELVTQSEEPDYFSALKHQINGDDKHYMFEGNAHYHFSNKCDERIQLLKAWYYAYKKNNIGVELRFEER